MKVDSPTNWRRILAGRESCKRHEIRNQNGARHRLGAQHGGERIERKMMAIRNKGRCEPIISQLRPDEIRMAGQHGGERIERKMMAIRNKGRCEPIIFLSMRS